MYEIETGHKVPKQRRKAGSVPKVVQQAFNDYAEAYKAVYGVRPLSFTYDRAKILGLVEKLAEALGDVLEVAQEVHEAKPEAFQPEHVERLQNAADLLNDRGELPDALLALLLAALGRGVKVETIRVELREGETPEQAVARVMAEREGGAATKH